MFKVLKTKPIRNFALTSTIALATLAACVPPKPILKETSSPYLTKKSFTNVKDFFIYSIVNVSEISFKRKLLTVASSTTRYSSPTSIALSESLKSIVALP